MSLYSDNFIPKSHFVIIIIFIIRLITKCNEITLMLYTNPWYWTYSQRIVSDQETRYPKSNECSETSLIASRNENPLHSWWLLELYSKIMKRCVWINEWSSWFDHDQCRKKYHHTKKFKLAKTLLIRTKCISKGLSCLMIAKSPPCARLLFMKYWSE